MKLKPKKDSKIPMPGLKRFLAADGESVVLNTYWRRLLKSGDVLEVKEIQPVKELKADDSAKKVKKSEGEK